MDLLQILECAMFKAVCLMFLQSYSGRLFLLGFFFFFFGGVLVASLGFYFYFFWEGVLVASLSVEMTILFGPICDAPLHIPFRKSLGQLFREGLDRIWRQNLKKKKKFQVPPPRSLPHLLLLH